MKCKNCGQQTSDKPMFCPNCGAPLQYSNSAHQTSFPTPRQPTPQPFPQTNYQSKKQQPDTTYTAVHKSNPREKWYKKNWVIVLFLIFCFPLGLFLMWKHSNWSKTVKIIVTITFAVFKICFWSGCGAETSEPPANITSTTAYVTEATTHV